MKTATRDFPLGYAEFRLRGRDGADAITIKAYTFTDLHKIIERLPVNMVFEVHLYCNGVRVGDAIYRRQRTHVKIEQETGACLNLFNGAARPASLPSNDLSLKKYGLFDTSFKGSKRVLRKEAGDSRARSADRENSADRGR